MVISPLYLGSVLIAFFCLVALDLRLCYKFDIETCGTAVARNVNWGAWLFSFFLFFFLCFLLIFAFFPFLTEPSFSLFHFFLYLPVLRVGFWILIVRSS